MQDYRINLFHRQGRRVESRVETYPDDNAVAEAARAEAKRLSPDAEVVCFDILRISDGLRVACFPVVALSGVRTPAGQVRPKRGRIPTWPTGLMHSSVVTA